jgi:hypothetical protein
MGYCEAGSVDGDGVAEVAVSEDFGGVLDCEGSAASFVMGVQFGDLCG